MYTVGRLAAIFGLSRSTLLYYDRLELLKPSGRSSGNYRLYTEADFRRLEQICLFREAGLPLKEIRAALESGEGQLETFLERRLEDLNHDIGRLREQQRLIVGLLKNRRALEKIGVMNKETWVALLAASGFSEDDMQRWHEEFERTAPEKHRAFLEFLCIPEDEIEIIRARAGEPGPVR